MVVELALAVTLLVGAGLLIRSFANISALKPGFESAGLVTVRIELPDSRYGEQTNRNARVDFADRLLAKLRALPGVEGVAFTSTLPFSNQGSQSSYDIEGRARVPGEPGPHGHIRNVDEDYFKVMKIPVLRGRTFDPAKDPIREVTYPPEGSNEPFKQNGLQSVVIDRLLAERHFKDKDPIGQVIINGTRGEIIGVVDVVKNRDLQVEPSKETY